MIQLAIWIILVLAVVAIVYYASRGMGIPIPSWVVNIIGIVVIAAVAIVALKFVAGL